MYTVEYANLCPSLSAVLEPEGGPLAAEDGEREQTMPHTTTHDEHQMTNDPAPCDIYTRIATRIIGR